MKIIKTASGKKKIKMSKKEWIDLGKKGGWLLKIALYGDNISEEEALLERSIKDQNAMSRRIEEAVLEPLFMEIDKKYGDINQIIQILRIAKMIESGKGDINKNIANLKRFVRM